MGYAREYKGARGWPSSKISMWVNGSRTRTKNNKQVVSPEEPNILRRHYGMLELGRLKNTMQEATILLRISFRKNESIVN